MELFYSANSPYARMVRIALREMGLSDRVTETLCALRTADNPALAHSPLGRVPLLVTDDGAALSETRIICHWLDERDPARPLFGPDPEPAAARAQDGLITGLLDGLVAWIREARRAPGIRSAAMIEAEAARAAACLTALESETIPDVPAYRACALVAALTLLDSRALMPGWQSGHPHLAAWLARQSARPAVAETAPVP